MNWSDAEREEYQWARHERDLEIAAELDHLRRLNRMLDKLGRRGLVPMVPLAPIRPILPFMVGEESIRIVNKQTLVREYHRYVLRLFCGDVRNAARAMKCSRAAFYAILGKDAIRRAREDLKQDQTDWQE